MATLKSLTSVGTTSLWMALASTLPLNAWAQDAATSTAPTEQETQLVNTVSDLLANKISTDECPAIRTLAGKLSTSDDSSLDTTSTVGQVLTAVKTKPELQSIVVAKVGQPLISKLLTCGMITPDLLNP